jgi:hypothetical protein
MQTRMTSGWSLVAMAVCAIVLGRPVNSNAQNVSGQARAVQATVGTLLGITTSILADTGTLSGPTDARHASKLSGSIGSLLTAETLHATAIAWPDQVASEASMAGLSLNVAGNTITAGFVQARITSVAGAAATRTSSIDGLAINGLAIDVSGDPNQTLSIPGGSIVINEQNGSVVNALHIIINGIADVVIASASADAQ